MADMKDYSLRALPVVVVVGLLFVSSGCGVSTAQLAPGAENIRVSKGDPGPNCREIGPISGESGAGAGIYGARGTYEDSYNLLRNRAVEMRATHVRMDSQEFPSPVSNKFIIRGIAFRCQ
jgi:hypothetical protein